VPTRDEETPFDSPALSEGYPLDKTERGELKRAIQELDRARPTRDGRSADAPERPAATA